MSLKKFICLFSLLTIIFLPTVTFAEPPSVAVLPFDNQSARQSTESLEYALENTRKYVEDEILWTGKFKQADRKNMQILLDSMKFDHSGLVDPATAAQYGKMIGAQYLVLGTVTGISVKGNETIAHLSLRMIEVERAVIFLAGRGTGKSKEKSNDGIREALNKAAEDALNGKRGILTMMHGKK